MIRAISPVLNGIGPSLDVSALEIGEVRGPPDSVALMLYVGHPLPLPSLREVAPEVPAPRRLVLPRGSGVSGLDFLHKRAQLHRVCQIVD